ncbi:hypothetical protein DL98DRAFT_4997 [Cadophora sp. DSE1049]|nr:hypothetical protein DL98DRAFT_4997 [Cadophora sp. DSE1049]
MSDRGLIREHPDLLRQTFDLHLGRPRDFIDESPRMNRGQNLPHSAMKDALIIGLHVKGDPKQLGKSNDVCQVGLSIFDTRHLTSATISNPQHQSLLVTHDYFVGSEKHFNRNSWRFCFGASSHGKQTTLDSLQQEIQEAVLNRDLILVVHGESGGSDGRPELLKAANIDLHPLYVIDTQKAAEGIFPLESPWSLERMLELLKCPFDPGMLLDAGNLPNVTLRTALLLAAVDAKNAPHKSIRDQVFVSTLERIGRDFVPLEEYREREKKQEKARYDRAQNRIQRRDARLEEAEERARKWLPANEADLGAQREAEEIMDKAFDEKTARTLAGWWMTKSGSWKMINVDDP